MKISLSLEGLLEGFCLGTTRGEPREAGALTAAIILLSQIRALSAHSVSAVTLPFPSQRYVKT